MTHLTIADHIVFALLAFVLPLVAVFRVSPQVSEIPQDSDVKIRLYWANSTMLWLGAFIILLVWYFGGHNVIALGFRPPSRYWFPEWMILTALFGLLYMFDTFVSWNEHTDSKATALLPANLREFLHFGSVVSISAGLCEEIIFRGFLINYLIVILSWTAAPALLAIGISAIIFGVVHAYQGWVAMIKIALLTVLFGGIFVISQSLVVVVILHFAVDFIGGLLGFLMHRKKLATSE